MTKLPDWLEEPIANVVSWATSLPFAQLVILLVVLGIIFRMQHIRGCISDYQEYRLKKQAAENKFQLQQQRNEQGLDQRLERNQRRRR